MNDFIKLTGICGPVIIRHEVITALCRLDTKNETEVHVLYSDSPFRIKETPEEIMAMINKKPEGK